MIIYMAHTQGRVLTIYKVRICLMGDNLCLAIKNTLGMMWTTDRNLLSVFDKMNGS